MLFPAAYTAIPDLCLRKGEKEAKKKKKLISALSRGIHRNARPLVEEGRDVEEGAGLVYGEDTSWREGWGRSV